MMMMMWDSTWRHENGNDTWKGLILITNVKRRWLVDLCRLIITVGCTSRLLLLLLSATLSGVSRDWTSCWPIKLWNFLEKNFGNFWRLVRRRRRIWRTIEAIDLRNLHSSTWSCFLWSFFRCLLLGFSRASWCTEDENESLRNSFRMTQWLSWAQVFKVLLFLGSLVLRFFLSSWRFSSGRTSWWRRRFFRICTFVTDSSVIPSKIFT